MFDVETVLIIYTTKWGQNNRLAVVSTESETHPLILLPTMLAIDMSAIKGLSALL